MPSNKVFKRTILKIDIIYFKFPRMGEVFLSLSSLTVSLSASRFYSEMLTEKSKAAKTTNSF